MARFPKRAALLSLIVLSSVSLSEAGKASSSTCKLSAGARFFDTCRNEGCCPRANGAGNFALISLSGGETGNCCSDTKADCGTGLSCCNYGTTTAADSSGWFGNTAATAEPWSTCIDPAIRGCCQYKIFYKKSGSTAARTRAARKTYDMATEECCSGAIVHEDETGSNTFPIVKKGQSCNYNPNKFRVHTSWSEMRKHSGRCAVDGDCINSGTCCRRRTWADTTVADADFTEGANDVYGTCVDSGVSCCGGGANAILVDAGTDTNAAAAPVSRMLEKNARAYDAAVEQCCPVTGQVIDKDSSCPCTADSQCNNGGTCCMSSAANVRACEATCVRGQSTTSTSSAPGCTGECTVPGVTVCWGCGDTKAIRTSGSLKNKECCTPTTSDKHVWSSKPSITEYTCTSTNCCPAGTIGGGTQDITGSNCACWSDSDCGGGWTCCNTQGASNAGSFSTAPGQCINPKTTGCCAVNDQDSDETYNLDSEICCPIGGRTTGSVCSCASNGDCQSGYECCQDKQEVGSYMNKNQANGKCIHTDTQECCDDPNKREGQGSVKLCFKEYEKCCNGQCCHNELDSCRKSDWSISVGGGVESGQQTAPVKDAHFKEENERCQKRMTPAIVFMAWVLPVFLTIFGLAALVGAIKVAFDAAMEERGAKSLRVAAIVTGALAHICLTLMLWSQFWQIAIFAMGCNIFIIAVIKTENAFARRAGMVVAFLITVIIVSPYWNNFFSFAVEPSVDGSLHRGLQRSLLAASSSDGMTACGNFFQWFTSEQLKPYRESSGATKLVDGRLHAVQIHTWGLCMWEWQQAIAVIGGLYICFQILFSMAAFAIFSRKMNQVAASKIAAME